MIPIIKGKEPKSWTAHRLTPGARYEATDDLREALLRDQGYLCAYCMRRIPVKDTAANETSRIEHIVPQSALSSDKECMDYDNMVVCCPGALEGVDESATHCDRHKAETPISFSPMDSNFIATLEYQSDGTIVSTNAQYDSEINEILNLNISLLKDNRREVKKSVVRALGRGVWKGPDLKRLIDAFSSLDRDGQLKPFCGVAIWYLQKKYHQISARNQGKHQ